MKKLLFLLAAEASLRVIPAKTIISEVLQKKTDVEILYIGGEKILSEK